MLRRLARIARREDGFGLIELTIAMTMLVIGIGALGGLFVSGHLALRRASQSDTAAVLASKLLERFRAETWDTVGVSKALFDSADPAYTNDAAYSSSTAITDASGLCRGTSPGFTSCWPSRLIPDASQSPVEVAPDGRSYRLDTYVNWGCADGGAPDMSTSPPKCSRPYSQVKIVTIVVRDDTSAATLAGTPIYRASTTFDRLAGGSMPAVTASPSSGTTTTTTTTSATSPPAAPAAVSLANGGGVAGNSINVGNVNSLSFDVALPDSSVLTDKIDLTVSDGNPDHDQTARLFGTLGSGIVHFTGINGQALADGPITVTVTATNAYGASAPPTTTTVTKDTVAVAPPAYIALANPQGSAHAVNASTASAVSVSVALDATSQSTDTVTVTLTNGASSTSAYTAPGTAGAGTATLTGINASSLADGTVTASAIVIDQAGNSSTAVTTTFPKDTTVPTATITRAGPSPTNALAVQWTIALSDAAAISTTNFNLVNTRLGGLPAITSVTGSGTSYTVTAGTGTGDGILGLKLNANSVQDTAGNVAAAVTGPAFTVDRTPLTITSPTSGQSGFNAGGPFTGTVSTNATTVTVKFCKDTTWSCGPTPTQTETATINGDATWSLTLSGGNKLSNNKSYVMRVTAFDAAGDTTTSADGSFHT